VQKQPLDNHLRDHIEVQVVLLFEVTGGRQANHDQELQLRPALMMENSIHRKP
jgi:hypothetical protein